MALGAVMNLVLTVWNTVLMPLAAWLVSTLGPVAAQVFNGIASVVGVAIGLVADAVNIGLTILQGLADFLTAVLQGRWSTAWNAMAATVTTVWSKITSTIQSAVSGILSVVRGMVSGIQSAINGLLSSISSVRSAAGSAIGSVMGYSLPVGLPVVAGLEDLPVPALAAGAVIPPNRKFLALLGDQGAGTNVEAPLATIRQAMAEVLAGWNGANDGRPINVYIGEELLDSVIANSERRRSLRSGGR